MDDKARKLKAWHSVLLGEAQVIAYLLPKDGEIDDMDLSSIALSLEILASQIRAEIKTLV